MTYSPSSLTRRRGVVDSPGMSKFWVVASWVVIVNLCQAFAWCVVRESFKEHYRKLLHGRKMRVSNKNNNFFGKIEFV
jgi:hypothetical protein